MNENKTTSLSVEMFNELEKRIPERLKERLDTLVSDGCEEMWAMSFYGVKGSGIGYDDMPKPNFIGIKIITILDYIKYWTENAKVIGITDKQQLEDYECINKVLNEIINEYKAKYDDFTLRYDKDEYHQKMKNLKKDF